MDNYTILCTKEQTRKALELDAPIETVGKKDDRPSIQYGFVFAIIPTAEQMLGWLEERGFEFFNYKPIDKWVVDVVNEEFFTTTKECGSRKEATLAAIDSALEYLKNNKK